MGLDLGFRGEVADFYARFRRAYPPAVIDSVVEAFGLTTDDVVVDLGCGTGQLTVPMAGRVRSIVGVDPEPDMLMGAIRTARQRGVTNATWMIGADSDMPTLRQLLGEQTMGAVTIGQAAHWMRLPELFPVLATLVRHGGGVAIVTNGTPLWLHDTAWSHALRDCLEHWLGTRLTATCGTDEASQQRYRDELTTAGFAVQQREVNYVEQIDLDYIIGNVYSALSVDRLPAPEIRPRLAQQLRTALRPHRQIIEHVQVPILIGRTHQRAEEGQLN